MQIPGCIKLITSEIFVTKESSFEKRKITEKSQEKNV